MSFLIDTDICSAQITGNRITFNKFMQHSGRLHVSVVTVAELVIWAFRAAAPPRRRQEVDDLLQLVTPLDVTTDVARKFGELQAALMDAGIPMPEMDLLIAATAVVHSLILVTHNTADYANVPGLTMLDWLSP
jgi:tRNA(fMet)-specific endonuclease VapC